MPLNKTTRIWELDAFRGFCILGMIIVHLVYDLAELSGLVRLEYNPLFLFVMDWGGVLFLLLSGICATLGSGRLRRGLQIFGCGMLITAVTVGMHHLGLVDASLIIRFGVLHCLGICMILWPVLKKLPTPILAAAGIAMIITGLTIRNLRVETPWLFWLGLVTKRFSSADYFPLLPFLGFFLIGTVLGRTLYRSKESLFPRANLHHPVIRFLTITGQWSLIIYLAHQPLIFLVTGLLAQLP